DKYIELTGPFNVPKTKNIVSQLCRDYGSVFTADGRIFYDDRNSLLKREINAFLAELKNIGLSYRLSEKMIKEKLNCLKK
ncbi:MAG: hypothetical protein PHU32_06305, partial [Candidatus ainarchaeum sp.]|nr:hypothetical protein [Candidatus ainarchaeum sp.]